MTGTTDSVGRVLGRPLLAGARRADRAFVVLYHRIGPTADPVYPPLAPAEFERHLDLLQSRFDIVTLSEVVRRVDYGEPLRGACAITFDDGFRDFLDHAYPALARRRLPVTHFLVSRCVQSGQPTWNYRLNRVLVARGERSDDIRRREKARLGAAVDDERETWLADCERALGIEDDGRMMLRADDLESVDPELVDWQSHSVSHAMMSRVSIEQAAAELNESRQTIEAWTGRPVHAFSYPNGDASASAIAATRTAGYRSGWLVSDRTVRPDGDVAALPRFDIGRYPVSTLPLVLSGALGLGRRLLRR